MKYLVRVEGRTMEIDIRDNGEIWVDGEKRQVDVHGIDNLDLYSVLHNNISYEVFAEEEAGQYLIQVHGELFSVEVKDAIGARVRKQTAEPGCPRGAVDLLAPIPGVVVGLWVDVGQAVEAGQVVAVLESMKMQNELKAPCAGKVKEIRVELEQAVESGQALMVIGAHIHG